MALLQIVRVFFEILTWLIVARALLTWFPNVPYNAVTKFIYETTEPVMGPIQRMLPYSLIPFSPIVAIIVVQLVERLVLSLLAGIMF
ncbi:MAG: YggT family protein [Clostridia bacterium]|nr:YggT family protein [Clostridia bacterium]